ncbi:MAG TPA: hypothetical protein VHO69_18525 [Phototrophicaceae bacterium]|nr:hypothetical protein [Phototrophicaceae bacterium]
MARSEKNKRNRRAFFILVLVVIVGGGWLWSQGELRNPLQSTAMLIGQSSGEAGFAMVGERPAPGEMVASSETTANTDASSAAETVSVAEPAAVEAAASSTGTMTLETLTAELAAAGVDIESVSATMAAEGRSLENLLSVVNSGRVTVAELASRLNGETTSETTAAAQPPAASSTALLDIRWEELDSVAYNLWFMLAATVVVIVVSRPVGWLVNRIKRAQLAPTV